MVQIVWHCPTLSQRGRVWWQSIHFSVPNTCRKSLLTFFTNRFITREITVSVSSHMHNDTELVKASTQLSSTTLGYSTLKKVAGRTLSTCNWYLTTDTCSLFTALTLPNNYLLYIPLERKSESSVTRPFLSAKGRQRQAMVQIPWLYLHFSTLHALPKSSS